MNLIFSAIVALFMSLTVTPTDPTFATFVEEMATNMKSQGGEVDYDGQNVSITMNIPAPLAEAQAMAPMLQQQMKQTIIENFGEAKADIKNMLASNNAQVIVKLVGTDQSTIEVTIAPDDI